MTSIGLAELGMDQLAGSPAAPGNRGAWHGVSLCLVLLAWLAFEPAGAIETWRGLTVAPEERCSPYARKRDYPYPQSIEHDIVRDLGAVYGPYTGTCFGSTKDTDIELCGTQHNSIDVAPQVMLRQHGDHHGRPPAGRPP